MTRISDHAVLRYLERHYGVDVDAVRAEMRVPALDLATKLGCCSVKMGNGMRLMLTGDTVVTVKTPRKRRAS